MWTPKDLTDRTCAAAAKASVSPVKARSASNTSSSTSVCCSQAWLLPSWIVHLSLCTLTAQRLRWGSISHYSLICFCFALICTCSNCRCQFWKMKIKMAITSTSGVFSIWTTLHQGDVNGWLNLYNSRSIFVPTNPADWVVLTQGVQTLSWGLYYEAGLAG